MNKVPKKTSGSEEHVGTTQLPPFVPYKSGPDPEPACLRYDKIFKSNLWKIHRNVLEGLYIQVIPCQMYDQIEFKSNVDNSIKLDNHL